MDNVGAWKYWTGKSITQCGSDDRGIKLSPHVWMWKKDRFFSFGMRGRYGEDDTDFVYRDRYAIITRLQPHIQKWLNESGIVYDEFRAVTFLYLFFKDDAGMVAFRLAWLSDGV